MNPARLKPFDFLLYSLVLFAWGTSWIGVHMQVGTFVVPEISVFWRFLIAGICMIGLALATGQNLRLPLAAHRLFVAMGFCLFCANFTFFYYGAQVLPSGLLSVVFSTASIFNLGLGFVLFRQKVDKRTLAGALLGAIGIALLFAPQILGSRFDHAALGGLGLCILGTLCFCFGNLVSAASQHNGVPVIAATAWSMLYGAGLIGLFGLGRGQSFALDMSASYLGSLIFLALSASVLAFWAYLTLLGRIGPGRAGYATVMFPIVALAISTVFEGYVWTLPAVIGTVLALAGNVLVLRR